MTRSRHIKLAMLAAAILLGMFAPGCLTLLGTRGYPPDAQPHQETPQPAENPVASVAALEPSPAAAPEDEVYASPDGKWSAALHTMDAIVNGRRVTLRTEVDVESEGYTIYFDVYREFSGTCFLEFSKYIEPGKAFTVENAGRYAGNYDDSVFFDFGFSPTKDVLNTHTGPDYDHFSVADLRLDVYDTDPESMLCLGYLKIVAVDEYLGERLELEGYFAEKLHQSKTYASPHESPGSGNGFNPSDMPSAPTDSKKQCSACDGTGKVFCTACDGTGSITETRLDSNGQEYDVELNCGFCGGQGRRMCNFCLGSGYVY